MSALTGRLISTSWPTAGERDALGRGRDRSQRINFWELPMRLGSLAVAAAMSVFVAPVGQSRVCHPASVRIASRNLCERSERTYAQYRRGGYRGVYRGAYYRGGYRRAYYAPRGVYRRTYRRAYRRAASYPSSYYGYTSPSSYYRPYTLSACPLSTGGPTHARAYYRRR